MQNRTVARKFSIGALWVYAGGAWHSKNWQQLNWFVVFHASIWGGLELCLGELSLQKPPLGDGTGADYKIWQNLHLFIMSYISIWGGMLGALFGEANCMYRHCCVSVIMGFSGYFISTHLALGAIWVWDSWGNEWWTTCDCWNTCCSHNAASPWANQSESRTDDPLYNSDSHSTRFALLLRSQRYTMKRNHLATCPKTLF